MRATETEAAVACAYLATLASASHATKYMPSSTCWGRRSVTSQVTTVGTVDLAASDCSADAIPCSSTAGWMPRASSRSSPSDWASSSPALVIIASADDGSRRMSAWISRSCRASGDQPLLGAVVQVALEPPPLGVAGRDDPLA